MVYFRPIVRVGTSTQCTHILRMPLPGRESNPQLQSSFHRFVQDPLTAQIPRVAMLSLDMLSLNVAALSLPTPDHHDTAWKVLNQLSRNNWEVTLRECQEVNSIQGTLRPSELTNLASGSSGTMATSQDTRSAFFMVDMVGIDDASGHAAKPWDPAAVMRLYAPLLDRSAILTTFHDIVVKRFLDAGLLLPDQRLCSQPMLAKVVDTMNAVSDSPPRMNSKICSQTGMVEWKRPMSISRLRRNRVQPQRRHKSEEPLTSTFAFKSRMMI